MRGPAVGTLRREAAPWGASIALHALLVSALALMPPPKRPKRLEEERVSVDILTQQQFEASTRPPPALAAEEPLPPAPAPAIPQPHPSPQ